MKRVWFGLIFFLVNTAMIWATSDPYFYKYTARPGDGIIILLSRYDLDQYDCNLDKFLELNHLKKNDPLMAGKKYQLPVLIYQYNGKSIRTTLSITDFEKAQRIADYNQDIFKKNLRQADYKSSGILWVPYH